MMDKTYLTAWRRLISQRHKARALMNDASGAAAVEFAIVGVLFMMMTAGLLQFQMAFGVMSGIQQLTAEAARASIAGLSAAERDSIARTFIANRAGGYGYLDPARMTVATSEISGTDQVFTVAIDYSFRDSLLGRFWSLTPMPAAVLHRSSSVRFGGA